MRKTLSLNPTQNNNRGEKKLSITSRIMTPGGGGRIHTKRSKLQLFISKLTKRYLKSDFQR